MLTLGSTLQGVVISNQPLLSMFLEEFLSLISFPHKKFVKLEKLVFILNNALRFCLSYPQVVSAIPEILNEKEVKENIIASNLGPLEAD
jgi:hypothetical protein